MEFLGGKNMNFKMIHQNFNVFDLDKSIEFYNKALGLKEDRRINAPDGSFIIVYLKNETTDFELELTWLRDMDRPYNLGDWLSELTTLKKLTNSTAKWVAFALKTRKWAFTSFLTQTATG